LEKHINQFLAKIYKFVLVHRRVGRAVDVAAVRERIVQQPLVTSSLQLALGPVMQILNNIFDSDITLLESFLTAVDNLSSYEPTARSFFVFFVHFSEVK